MQSSGGSKDQATVWRLGKDGGIGARTFSSLSPPTFVPLTMSSFNSPVLPRGKGCGCAAGGTLEEMLQSLVLVPGGVNVSS